MVHLNAIGLLICPFTHCQILLFTNCLYSQLDPGEAGKGNYRWGHLSAGGGGAGFLESHSHDSSQGEEMVPGWMNWSSFPYGI